MSDAESLNAVLADIDLLVNAVGPYCYDPAPVVGACREAHCHYLDLAEDPAFIAAVEAAGQDAEVCVAAGCSTVPGTIELLAHGFGPGVAAVEAWLSIGSANPASPGLLYGLLRPLGRRDPDGTRYFGALHRHHVSDGRLLGFGRHPAAFVNGGLAVEQGRRRVPARFYTGFDRGPFGAGLVAAAPLLGRLGDRALRRLCRAGAPAARALAPFGTARGVLRVEGLSQSGEVVCSAEIHAEREGLDIPAAPVVWVARRIVAGELDARGPQRLPALVPRHDALTWLTEATHRIVLDRT